MTNIVGHFNLPKIQDESKHVTTFDFFFQLYVFTSRQIKFLFSKFGMLHILPSS